MKKLIIVLLLVGLTAAIATAAGAREERTLEQRVAELEAKVAALMACNPISCDAPSLGQSTGIFGQSGGDVTISETITPTEIAQPTVAQPPEPGATVKPKCNQGVGNGPEGCDPGNSNNHNPSNDENPTNRGGKKVP